MFFGKVSWGEGVGSFLCLYVEAESDHAKRRKCQSLPKICNISGQNERRVFKLFKKLLTSVLVGDVFFNCGRQYSGEQSGVQNICTRVGQNLKQANGEIQKRCKYSFGTIISFSKGCFTFFLNLGVHLKWEQEPIIIYFFVKF